MYLFDTNICIYAINGRHPKLTEKIFKVSPDEILISAVTVSELEYGASKSNWGERTRQIMHAFLANFEILNFTEKDACVLGQNRAFLERSGQTIGIMDLMIGSQAVSNDLICVTHNTKEFIRIPDIRLEDWVE